MAFDEESGLVYKERIVSAPVSQAADHERASQARIAKFKIYSKTGPRSLRESVIRKLLCNLKKLDANSLEGLPAAILELLWTRISAARLNDFRTWRAFAQTPLGGCSFVHTEHIGEESLRSNLDIFRRAGSSMAWLTTLTLGSRPMSSVELAGVAKVRNVRHIYISPSPTSGPDLTDSALHSWAEAAKTGGAFSKLEVLFIEGQQHISYGAFHHITQLPALHTCLVYWCGITMDGYTGHNERLTQSLGWRLSKSNTCSLFKFGKQHDSKQEIPVTNRGLFLQYVEHLRGLDASGKLPTLYLALGNARHTTPWNRKTALCFERDSTVAPCAPKNKHRAGSGAHTEYGTAKKRKIRDGKAFALNDLLVL
ncbi:hypothetical protein EJ03DRAFT_42772 [Teratosphaeria nubilosa]|uniref:Uncharacterized protein n=1 Tax=Teratosphaeria nubilosa TaxID=161662 RepID=A0A6G1KTP0_9PEZI|nr:hypothetical protein EJ03DRAFT_42772 [Teratosphaeria nubilosa]